MFADPVAPKQLEKGARSSDVENKVKSVEGQYPPKRFDMKIRYLEKEVPKIPDDNVELKKQSKSVVRFVPETVRLGC